MFCRFKLDKLCFLEFFTLTPLHPPRTGRPFDDQRVLVLQKVWNNLKKVLAFNLKVKTEITIYYSGNSTITYYAFVHINLVKCSSKTVLF